MPLSCHWWAILHHPLPVHCLWYRRRVGWLGRRLLLRSLSEYQLSAEESECSGGLVQLHVHLLRLEHHNHHYIWVPIALYPVFLTPNKVICSLLFAWWTELFGDKISNQNILCWDDGCILAGVPCPRCKFAGEPGIFFHMSMMFTIERDWNFQNSILHAVHSTTLSAEACRLGIRLRPSFNMEQGITGGTGLRLWTYLVFSFPQYPQLAREQCSWYECSVAPTQLPSALS